LEGRKAADGGDEKKAKQASKSSYVIAVVLSLILLGFLWGCHSSKSKLAEPAPIPCCQTADTLQELVFAGIDRMRAWYGNDSFPPTDSLAKAIATAADSLKSKISGPDDTVSVSLIIDQFFNKWQIAFNPDVSILDAAFPTTVIVKKQGTCLGISLLMLLVAEKAGLPYYGVLLPGHFFVRFDNGATRRNIEPNARGIERSERYYREHYSVGADSWYTMGNLSKKEVAAVFFYQLGKICGERRSASREKFCYRTALSLFPRYPEALGNLACLYAPTSFDSAKLLLEEAGRINPRDPQIWENLGALAFSYNHFDEAIVFYDRGRAIAPELPKLLIGSAKCYEKIGRNDSVKMIFEKIRTIKGFESAESINEIKHRVDSVDRRP
jgi:regulator of sirC expression with transglutaminase-like and TPR domain